MPLFVASKISDCVVCKRPSGGDPGTVDVAGVRGDVEEEAVTPP